MGAKKKKAKEEKVEEVIFVPKPLPRNAHESMVNITFQLLNWKYMNFTMKFRDSTKIFTIKKLLRERHGRMDDLKICKNSFTESNELNDEMLTLKEYKLIGRQPTITTGEDGEYIVDESEIPCVKLFYDFKPSDFADPVLLFFKS